MCIISEMKKHVLFSGVAWDHQMEMKMPFIPVPGDATDTSYFDGMLYRIVTAITAFEYCNGLLKNRFTHMMLVILIEISNIVYCQNHQVTISAIC